MIDYACKVVIWFGSESNHSKFKLACYLNIPFKMKKYVALLINVLNAKIINQNCFKGQF